MIHRDQVFDDDKLVSETVWDTTAATVTTFKGGTQTGTRAMTQDEIDRYEKDANQKAIQDNLEQDMSTMQTIVDTPNTAITVTTFPQAQQAARDALQRDKDIARNLKRLDRTELQDYTEAD